MIILPAQNVDMQCNPGSDGKRVEDMGDHLRRQVANLFSLEAEVRDTVGAGADVDDCTR